MCFPNEGKCATLCSIKVGFVGFLLLLSLLSHDHSTCYDHHVIYQDVMMYSHLCDKSQLKLHAKIGNNVSNNHNKEVDLVCNCFWNTCL